MEHAEAIVHLLDFCWFEQEIFAKRAHGGSTIHDQDQEIAERSSTSGAEEREIIRVPSVLLRSMSDQLSSQASFLLDSPSPKSVLRSPSLLCPIDSGKEISDEGLPGFEKQRTGRAVNSQLGGGRDDRRRMRKKKAQTRSLSELEFEELKGFMDLGFVFSEEDKDSSLASIIPGLQRLGKKDKEEKEEKEKEKKEEQDQNDQGETDRKSQESGRKVSSLPISRPYLSETWEWLDWRKEEERPLVVWDFPALSNETDMKDNLRWWAHTVASTVR